jgi:membrane-bound lytic murein transglycosylase MltF
MPPMKWTLFAAFCSLIGGLACGPGEAPVKVAEPSAQTPDAPEEIEPAPDAEPLPPGLAPFVEPFTGDLDGMVERRIVRVLTVASPVLYFVDRGRELGLIHEASKALETQLNNKLQTGHLKVHVILMPVARNELLPRLVAGQGDVAAAMLTVTPERSQLVDFTDPTATGITEIVVTGPSSRDFGSVDDLSGQEIHVRASSSYAEHLRALNQRLESAGKPPIQIVPADELLEDGDLLEMVAAGLIPATVADSFMVDLWKGVFPTLKPHRAAPIATGGELAIAFRKGSPQLAGALNAFVKTEKQGTLAGNMLVNKYLRSTKWVKNARSEQDIARFRSMVALFQKYSDRYSFDWLLMAAQAYQESGLDQSKRSPVGAIGVMQVMPTTARDKAVNIPDIENLESNIHAGIKYNRWVVDNFYNEEAVNPLNRQLFAFASYNAGPGRVKSLREEAAQMGLDANRWFNNVEAVAAKRIGRETVQYVANIYKYYLAYQLVMQQSERRDKATSSP